MKFSIYRLSLCNNNFKYSSKIEINKEENEDAYNLNSKNNHSLGSNSISGLKRPRNPEEEKLNSAHLSSNKLQKVIEGQPESTDDKLGKILPSQKEVFNSLFSDVRLEKVEEDFLCRNGYGIK